MSKSDWKNWFDVNIQKHHSLMHYLWEVWVYNAELIYDIRGNRIQLPASVLELGCGSGLEILSVLAAHGYKVTGLDIEQDVLDFAKSNFDKLGLHADFIHGDMFDIEIEQKFDLVYSVGVIEHFMTHEKIIKAVEIHKKFSKEWVVLLVPSQFVYDEAKKLNTFSNTPDWIAMSVEDLTNIARKAGLEIINTFGYGKCDGPFARSQLNNCEGKTELHRTLCIVCKV